MRGECAYCISWPSLPSKPGMSLEVPQEYVRCRASCTDPCAKFYLPRASSGCPPDAAESSPEQARGLRFEGHFKSPATPRAVLLQPAATSG